MALQLQNKRILVTGATGFIGTHLCRRLLKEGADVRIIARNLAKADTLRSEGADVNYSDLTDYSSLYHAVKNCHIVFHCAGVLGNEAKSWSYFKKINIEGSRLIAAAALNANVERFIFLSTSWVYGMDAKGHIDEKSPVCLSKSPYCDSKIEAEILLRKFLQDRGLPLIIVQPSPVYGTGKNVWINSTLKLTKAGIIFSPDNGAGLLQPIYIDDLIDGIILAVQKGRIGESYIMCGPETVTVRDYFNYFLQMTGRKKIPSLSKKVSLKIGALAELVTKYTPLSITTTEVIRGIIMQAIYSNEKARRELGFEPKFYLEEGMKKVKKWLQKEGYIHT